LATTAIYTRHTTEGRSIIESISSSVDYGKNPDKTRNGELISCYECNPVTVANEWLLTKNEYHKRTGRKQNRKNDILMYQIRQSFTPGEVTPEEANRIGYELAMRFTKGKHSFIVTTHEDTDHIHSHIYFNSTTLDCTRKFKNFWGLAFALRRLSDHICVENGLSIIRNPKKTGKKYYQWLEEKYREGSGYGGAQEQVSGDTSHNSIRNNSYGDSYGKVSINNAINANKDNANNVNTTTDLQKPPTNRQIFAADIDAALLKSPQTYTDFLRQLIKMGYKIKHGKHISLSHSKFERPIRLKSMMKSFGEIYTEDGIKRRIAEQIASKTAAGGVSHFDGAVQSTAQSTANIEHGGHKNQSNQQSNQSDATENETIEAIPKPQFNMLIDIENSIKAKNSPAYENWAKTFNAKQVANTLIYLQDNELDDYKKLEQRVAEIRKQHSDLQDKMRPLDTRMKEISSLQKQISTYISTRKVFDEYRKSRYSKKFLAENEGQIIKHRAAKKFFNEQGLDKLPTIKALKAEYATLKTKKDKLYGQYKKVQEDLKAIAMVKTNADQLLGFDKKTNAAPQKS